MFKTEKDSLSYAYGLYLANQLASQNINDLDLNLFKQGMENSFSKSYNSMTLNEAQEIITNHQASVQKNAGKGNKDAGESFLSKNKTRAEVTTTASGLQYEVLKSGNGKSPSLTSTVETHYHGTLIDGSVFDSSVERGESISFPVNGVIKGWTEALQMMKEGDKWKLFIPYQLAYGERGAGASIGPYSALIFEVELIAVK